MTETPDDRFDMAIDRSAQQLIGADPPPGLYRAVMAEIGASSHTGPGAWLRWTGLVAACAALVVGVLLWRAESTVERDRNAASHREVRASQGPSRETPGVAAQPAPPPMPPGTVTTRAERRRQTPDLSVPAVLPAANDMTRVNAIAITTVTVENLAVGPTVEIPAIELVSRN